FFFSSRRRHTRWPRDWSSDVCSSDLGGTGQCTGTEIICNLLCVDPLTDPKNCGKCGNACMTGELCELGFCAMNCTAPLENCGMRSEERRVGKECRSRWAREG